MKPIHKVTLATIFRNHKLTPATILGFSCWPKRTIQSHKPIQSSTLASRTLSPSPHAALAHVRRLLLHPGAGAPARSFYAQPYQAKVGVVEFLNGVGKGVETHAAKLEEAVGGDLQRLLETRTLRLKKLGVPVKHRKLILSFAHKYRLGLWKPPAEARKAQ